MHRVCWGCWRALAVLSLCSHHPRFQLLSLPMQVPNIKFNVAKQLQGLAPLLNPTVVTQQIKPCLQELMEDDDTDVKYFAQQAMQACNSLTVGA